MKKSLIALAVLAASGAAMAQSTATLYGLVDAWVGTSKDNLNTGAGTAPISQSGINDGGLSSSRWGIRGTEDLGGGLKANFQLEQAVSVDTGTAANFGRQAWVGLSGNFGEVRVGRTLTAYDTVLGAVNANANSNMAVTGAVFTNGVAAYAARMDNQVRYDSPAFNGFRVAVSYGFGENKTATFGKTDSFSLAAWYAAGPLVLGFAHQQDEAAAMNGATPAVRVGNAERTNTAFGGSYNFGTFAVSGAYNIAEQDAGAGVGNEDKEWLLGVSVPMGATTLFAGYARSQSENAAGAKLDKASGFALHAQYAMSKRTTAYVGFRDAERKNAAGVKQGELQQFSVGVRHNF